jgi:NAD-dependent DNA ligase
MERPRTNSHNASETLLNTPAIRRIGEAQAINQEEAAERCGLHRTYYSGITSGVDSCPIPQRREVQTCTGEARAECERAGWRFLAPVFRVGEQWLIRAEQPIDPGGSRLERDGNPEGELAGEVLVFTGAPFHAETRNAAAAAGCRVDGGVTKHTTMLVVGDQDISKTKRSPEELETRKGRVTHR